MSSSNAEHLLWLRDRLIHVYKEDPYADFIHRLEKGLQTMTSRSGRFILMKDRTDQELDQTIANAESIGKVVQQASNLMVNPFWEFCAGIDAYFEKRKRKEERDKANANIENLRSAIDPNEGTLS